MKIKTISVLGANGSMGKNVSALFAAFGGAKVYMICRNGSDAEKAVRQAARSVKADSIIPQLIAADYSEMEKCIQASDLVFESVSENIEIKVSLLTMVAQYINDKAVLCTGTSGLSVTRLEERLPINVHGRLIGLHLFNPPYSMPLCEIIQTPKSAEGLVAQVGDWAKNILYRTVVYAKDTPAFLGNRIGFYCINMAMQYAERYKDSGGIEYIDAILGPFSGRTMAPLDTADFVGLDVHKAIVDNVYNHVHDYAHDVFKLPRYVESLITVGHKGRKSSAGLYRKTKIDGVAHVQVFDIGSNRYQELTHFCFPFKNDLIDGLRTGDYDRAFNGLLKNQSTEACLCVEFLLKYVLYALFAAREVNGSCHDADAVMAAGFNWAPPLAVIDALGGKNKVFQLMKERLPEELSKVPDFANLLFNAEPSRYDYRRFFRAKP